MMILNSTLENSVHPTTEDAFCKRFFNSFTHNPRKLLFKTNQSDQLKKKMPVKRCYHPISSTYHRQCGVVTGECALIRRSAKDVCHAQFLH